VAAVLSGNRNFEARIHQRIKSKLPDVAHAGGGLALAGRVDVDLTAEPVGTTPGPAGVHERHLAEQRRGGGTRSATRQAEVLPAAIQPDLQRRRVLQRLAVKGSTTFAWEEASTYVRKPPYFDGFSLAHGKPSDIRDAARCC